ncbi:MAG: hypothetical protein V3R78_14045 [Thermodesulfobacteriota bacterium]
MPIWLAIGIEPMTTEEPYEGNLHVRDCGGGAWVTGAPTRK